MRIPLLHADFEHGSYTKIAKALRKVWPLGELSLMQSQNSLAVLFSYNGLHDAQREATESFSIPEGSLRMKEVESSVVKQMYIRFGIDPVSGRKLVTNLHLNELAVAKISAEAKQRLLIEAALQQGAGSIETKDSATAHLFFDEAGYYFGQNNDSLRETLRKIEGVPNAVYLVRSDRVFVFEKLLQLVEAVGMTNDDPDFEGTARRLVDDACVTPLEAIEQWKIIPEPYELEELAGGEVAIRHKPFNACVPGFFNSRDAARPALINLLLGKVVTGIGEFEYRGQPLTLREPLDLNGFTMAPPAVGSGVEPNSMWLRLDRIEWRPGFSPVPESLFVKAKGAEAAWKRACAGMEEVAGSLVANIWAEAEKLDLGRLNSPVDVVSEHDQEQVKGLRSCYSELPMLSDGTLWSTYDAYQMECWHTTSWDPGRDEDFIFFLIGLLTDPRCDGYSAIPLGKWVIYHLTRGHGLDNAHRFACQVRFNSDLVGKIANRFGEAMLFLEHDAQAMDLRGQRISTFGDFLRMSRKRFAPVIVTQEMSKMQ